MSLPSWMLVWLLTLAFALLHSGLATPAVADAVRARTGWSAARWRLIYSLTAVVTTGIWLAAVHALPDRPLYALHGAAYWACVALQALGAGVVWAAFREFDGRVFLGLAPMPAEGEPFHERGIYRHLRHPMYAGVMLILLASPVQSVNSLHLALAASLYFIIGARREEARMRAAHPQYDDYRRRVPAFLPRLASEAQGIEA
ncbi:MAG: isoprenylcysteine carboxylmethyltransferase family protein [Mariprofundaceae bacterium]